LFYNFAAPRFGAELPVCIGQYFWRDFSQALDFTWSDLHLLL
jgi:hypothetical protein